MANRWNLPVLGYGIGLRTVHFAEILDRRPAIDFYEAITENFLDTGGRPLHVLDRIAERTPVVLHGVSLNIGSTSPIDLAYLGKVKELARRVNAPWVTDHLCWTGVAGRNTHDLLPLPLNEESLGHVAARVRIVQDSSNVLSISRIPRPTSSSKPRPWERPSSSFGSPKRRNAGFSST